MAECHFFLHFSTSKQNSLRAGTGRLHREFNSLCNRQWQFFCDSILMGKSVPQISGPLENHETILVGHGFGSFF